MMPIEIIPAAKTTKATKTIKAILITIKNNKRNNNIK